MNYENKGSSVNIPFADKKAQDSGTENPAPRDENPEEPRRAQRLRRRAVKISALIVILLPTFLSGIYYGLIATNQYAVEVRFAVRGINASSGSDLLSMVTGMPSGGSTTADSYILMDYIRSREVIEILQKKINIRQIYSRDKADILSSFDVDEPIEEFIEYWKKMITLSYDNSSQIIVVEVRAFTPEDARLVATQVLELSGALVNELSAKARDDAVGHAEKEVERMELRLRASRHAVRAFREKEQVIDPSKTAESQIGLLAKLEIELSTERAKLNSMSQFMDKDSPRIVVLTSKIKALEAQAKAERASLGESKGKDGGALTGLLEDYRILLMDQEFAEKAYISTLTSLETARLEAGRQQRYLATFVLPRLPEDSLYPKRLLNFFLTFIISVIAWAIGTLIVYAIRDHTM